LERVGAVHRADPFVWASLVKKAMTIRTTVIGVCLLATVWFGPRPALAQQESTGRPKAQVEMVQTFGCVERRGDGWWLTRAAEPTVTRPGLFNRTQVAEVEEGGVLGTGEHHLVGVADFLTAEGLLGSFDRAEFTAPEQVNATGELRDGRTVLLKGLLIEADGATRINLTSVVGLTNRCR
jgi:hypothetical protein